MPGASSSQPGAQSLRPFALQLRRLPRLLRPMLRPSLRPRLPRPPELPELLERLGHPERPECYDRGVRVVRAARAAHVARHRRGPRARHEERGALALLAPAAVRGRIAFRVCRVWRIESWYRLLPPYLSRIVRRVRICDRVVTGPLTLFYRLRGLRGLRVFLPRTVRVVAFWMWWCR